MITSLVFNITTVLTRQIMDRFDLLTKAWKQKGKLAELFDKNSMVKIMKQLDKSQSTAEIERRILYLKFVKQTYIQGSNEQHNYIVLIDNSEVKQASIDKVEEWIDACGEILKKMASTELKQIIRDTQDYGKALNGEMGDIDQLKALLNVISDIKNKSMDMEFRIIEVQEQFRVLNMYNFEIEEEIQKDTDTLMTNWEDLLDFADKKDFEVNDFKKNFAEVTKQDVANFKIKIMTEFEKYNSHGPGTFSV
jgi:hypothetical protein